MRGLAAVAMIMVMVAVVSADVYMHNPRGSNNRLDEATRPRRNGNRMFDSQNNCRGGYNVGNMDYVAGSELPIEWTAQHSCANPNTHCEYVLQYMCDDTSPGGLRDGTTTGTIPTNQQKCRHGDCELDFRYGRHEHKDWYFWCKRRERNKGLFTASQNLRGNSAIYTRQNPNGNRRGLECPEERDYYPYWHPTPWVDIAIMTDSPQRCEYYQKESQNVMNKGVCYAPSEPSVPTAQNNPAACAAAGNVWNETGAWNVPPPACVMPDYSRDNHLGNVPGGFPQTFNWTVPSHVGGRCALRLRYNISTADYDGWNTFADKNDRQGRKVNIKNNGEEYRFKNDPQVDFGVGFDLQLAINTAQYGRTFQDRSHAFSIVPLPDDVNPATRIANLNVRGKRGNIVQVYPAVEYDFVPNNLEVTDSDLIHIQWTGSNTNPNNNDGQGKQGTDRSNMMQIRQNDLGRNYPENIFVANITNPFFARVLALVDPGQHGGETSELDDAGTYFNGGLMRAPAAGTYNYMCTRNNNFSNRSQKGRINVSPTLRQAAKVLANRNTTLSFGREAQVNIQPGSIKGDVQEITMSTTDTFAPPPTIESKPAVTAFNSKVLSLQPHGTTFEQPITVRLNYSAPEGTDVSTLVLVRADNSKADWAMVPWATFDPSTSTVSVETLGFSLYAVATLNQELGLQREQDAVTGETVVVDSGGSVVGMPTAPDSLAPPAFRHSAVPAPREHAKSMGSGSLAVAIVVPVAIVLVAVGAATFYRMNPHKWNDHRRGATLLGTKVRMVFSGRRIKRVPANKGRFTRMDNLSESDGASLASMEEAAGGRPAVTAQMIGRNDPEDSDIGLELKAPMPKPLALSTKE